MHHLPIVPILLVIIVIAAPAILRALKGGSASVRTMTDARPPAQPETRRPNARAELARFAELAKGADPRDPGQIASIFAEMERRLEGGAGELAFTQGNRGTPEASGALATAALGFAAEALRRAPATAAFAQRSMRQPAPKKKHARANEPDLSGRTVGPYMAPLDARAPLAPLKPRPARAPHPVKAVRAPQQPLAL